MELIQINKDNQKIHIHLMMGSERLNDKGECGDYEYNTLLYETQMFSNYRNLIKWLEGFGLELNEFTRFNKEDEPNRLNFSREEKENGRSYYVDYDLYVEIYTWDNKKDYLKEFKE